jgi:hypothetical protein
MSVIDETLQELGMARIKAVPLGDPSSRNAAIAYTAIENAVLAAKSGDVRWSYCEHELTTARLRWPSLDCEALERAVLELFRAGPPDSGSIRP